MGQYVFKLPDLGEGTVESEIVEWHVQPGEVVVQDQHIADVMTDKATVELTAPVAGVVASLAGAAGDVIAVGSELIRFDVEGEGNAESVSEAPAPVAEEPVAPIAEQPAEPAAASGRFVFKLPDLGEGTVESEIAEWHVAVGDSVKQDQVIADVMTDKATVELTAPVSGTVVSLAGAAGDVVAVGSELITFAVDGDGNAPSVEAVAPVVAEPTPIPVPKPAAPAPAPKPAAPAAAVSPKVPTAAATSKDVLASPAVRRRALDADIDLADVPGSGPAGRVEHNDLDNFIATGGNSGSAMVRVKKNATTEIPVRGLRRLIAQKMQQSKRQIPHFTYVEEMDVTELEALRQHMNATRRDDQPKLTLLAYIMQAVTKVMAEFPQFNATFDDTNNIITRYQGVHLGIAAQTDDGLKVPVVKHAEALDVWGLANEMSRVALAAKNNAATKDELTGGTITITSLGPLGGLVHTPVINYPEVAIIGTNNMVERPVVKDGEIVVRKMMNISSSFDHRVIDGYDAAQMIQRVKQLLEHPATLFI
ncbi:2-oxo acid dehydrogenase subunit E2 [Porticoccus sp. W117]|uniref:2-oxo acid dehydrogenase subunit E2 n=1 Tax=Porticoccus sp. W117 TaxID=3054777 RepID=UPI0025923D07|nr:2-oxo acid dehydrogenase subunit E2 [Porticoccus sp. W117]MDM3870690.1 2-oxo acid dehydrogenase subunit E2 [Porticoccus sp. W117]